MIYFYVICFMLVVFDFGLAVCNFKFWYWCGSVQFRVVMYQFGLLCLMTAEIINLLGLGELT